ncbi:MAG: hypothetical protein AB8B92_00890 [Gammaproteobacteria bacterium]
MTQARKQFYKTTEQYFQNTNENIYHSKKDNSKSNIRKFYIKEEPFINSTDVEYK